MLNKITKELKKIILKLKVAIILCSILLLILYLTPLGDIFNGKVKEKVEEFKEEAKEKIEKKIEVKKEKVAQKVRESYKKKLRKKEIQLNKIMSPRARSNIGYLRYNARKELNKKVMHTVIVKFNAKKILGISDK